MEHRRSQGERRRSVSCDIDDCYRVPVLYRYSRYRYLAHGQYDYGGTVQFVRYSKIVEGTQWYRYDTISYQYRYGRVPVLYLVRYYRYRYPVRNTVTGTSTPRWYHSHTVQ